MHKSKMQNLEYRLQRLGPRSLAHQKLQWQGLLGGDGGATKRRVYWAKEVWVVATGPSHHWNAAASLSLICKPKFHFITSLTNQFKKLRRRRFFQHRTRRDASNLDLVSLAGSKLRCDSLYNVETGSRNPVFRSRSKFMSRLDNISLCGSMNGATTPQSIPRTRSTAVLALDIDSLALLHLHRSRVEETTKMISEASTRKGIRFVFFFMEEFRFSFLLYALFCDSDVAFDAYVSSLMLQIRSWDEDDEYSRNQQWRIWRSWCLVIDLQWLHILLGSGNWRLKKDWGIVKMKWLKEWLKRWSYGRRSKTKKREVRGWKSFLQFCYFSVMDPPTASSIIGFFLIVASHQFPYELRASTDFIEGSWWMMKVIVNWKKSGYGYGGWRFWLWSLVKELKRERRNRIWEREGEFIEMSFFGYSLLVSCEWKILLFHCCRLCGWCQCITVGFGLCIHWSFAYSPAFCTFCSWITSRGLRIGLRLLPRF